MSKGNMPPKQTLYRGLAVSEAPSKEDITKDKAADLGGEFNESYKSTNQSGVRGTLLPSNKGDTGGSVGYNPREKLKIQVHDLDKGDHFEIDPNKPIPVTPKLLVGDREKMTPGRRRELHTALKEVAAGQKSSAVQNELEDGYDQSELAEYLEAGAVQEEQRMLDEAVARAEGIAAPVPDPIRMVPASSTPQVALPPTKRIIFEFGGPMGSLETYYHDIIKSGDCLVLCWDPEWQGQRYIPGVSREKPPTLTKVIVGREQEELMVASLGIRFTLKKQRLELTVLIIYNEPPEAATPVPPVRLAGMQLGDPLDMGGSRGGEMQFI